MSYDPAEDEMLEILLEGLEDNSRLDEKRKLVNSILPVDKYKLLQKILSEDQQLAVYHRLDCLPILLDKRTKYFSFEQDTDDYRTIVSIMEMVPKYCPKLATIDFRTLMISPLHKEAFKTFLKKSTQLNSLRVKCHACVGNCAIYELLFKDEFHLLDRDVQNGLLKIQYLDAFGLTSSQCAGLIKQLPNLKSFGMHQSLIPMLTDYANDNVVVRKLSNITEFYDKHTSLTTLELFAEFFRKAEKICLRNPERQVVENLWKFPLIRDITIASAHSDFVTELIDLLTKIGEQIRSLDLHFTETVEVDESVFRKLCPRLANFEPTFLKSL